MVKEGKRLAKDLLKDLKSDVKIEKKPLRKEVMLGGCVHKVELEWDKLKLKWRLKLRNMKSNTEKIVLNTDYFELTEAFDAIKSDDD